MAAADEVDMGAIVGESSADLLITAVNSFNNYLTSSSQVMRNYDEITMEQWREEACYACRLCVG